MAQRSIEIYVRDLPADDAVAWLSGVFEAFEDVPDAPIPAGQGRYGDAAVSVQIAERVQGGPFTSLWFRADALPWEGAADCGRAAYNALGREVICDPERLADQPWKLLRISETGEHVVDERDVDFRGP